MVKLANTLSNTLPLVKTSTKSLPYSLDVASGNVLLGIDLQGPNCLAPSSSSLAADVTLSLLPPAPACP